MPIDTLKAARRLKELGFEEHQAEGLAELLSDLDVASATKEDLDDLEERLSERFERMEARFEERLDEQVAQLEERLDKQETRSEERLDDRASRLEERIDSLETRIETGLKQEREGRIQLEKNLTERINGVEKGMGKQIAEAKNTLLIAVISCAVLITGILGLILSYTS